MSNDMASISYLTVKEILGEEVVSSIKLYPERLQKNNSDNSTLRKSIRPQTEISILSNPKEFNELETKLENKSQEIETLKILVETLLEEKVSGIERIELALENSVELETPYISQNIPNPTANDAIIKYYVPENSISAIMRFYSLWKNSQRSRNR